MGVLTQSVAVECGADGTPQGLRWNGRDYVLAERPVRWFEGVPAPSSAPT